VYALDGYADISLFAPWLQDHGQGGTFPASQGTCLPVARQTDTDGGNPALPYSGKRHPRRGSLSQAMQDSGVCGLSRMYFLQDAAPGVGCLVRGDAAGTGQGKRVVCF